MNKNSSGLSTTIAFWTHRLSLSVLLVGCLCSPSWGQVKKTEITGSPTVNDEQVTVRIKVKDTDDKPAMGLHDTDFSLLVDKKPVKFSSQNWKSATETVPPPAWIIFLLDFSGSMSNHDSSGKSKLQGAINAIRKSQAALAERGGNTQVAIVPFGEPGPNCQGFTVSNEELNKFFPAGDYKLNNYLDFLAAQVPCASTNIYEPLSKAIRLFASNKRFNVPEGSDQPQPRLSVILLSDGYQNKANEVEDFKNLISLLKRNDKVIVHTLGYGLTPEQLSQKYHLRRPAERGDIGIGAGKVPEDDFVDRERLAEIAKVTGGMAEFSADAQTVTEKLKLFLDALLGEYEITYTEPNAERGSKHDVRAVVQSDTSEIRSEQKSYTIGVFGRSLPWDVRLLMVLIVLLLILNGGIIPFCLWAKKLKQEAQEI